jgi:hypothetical protein
MRSNWILILRFCITNMVRGLGFVFVCWPNCDCVRYVRLQSELGIRLSKCTSACSLAAVSPAMASPSSNLRSAGAHGETISVPPPASKLLPDQYKPRHGSPVYA